MFYLWEPQFGGAESDGIHENFTVSCGPNSILRFSPNCASIRRHFNKSTFLFWCKVETTTFRHFNILTVTLQTEIRCKVPLKKSWGGKAPLVFRPNSLRSSLKCPFKHSWERDCGFFWLHLTPNNKRSKNDFSNFYFMTHEIYEVQSIHFHALWKCAS